MMRKIVFSCLLLLSTVLVHGQNYQAEYLEAKRIFNTKDFVSAKNAFRSLIASSEKHKFGEYASFFYGLSSFNQAEYRDAKDMWLQTLAKYPDWQENDETRWWLASAYFKLEDYNKGTQIIDQIRDSKLKKKSENLKTQYYRNIKSLRLLDKLYQTNSEDETLGRFFLSYLLEQDSLYAYEETARKIVSDFDYQEEDFFSRSYEVVKKESYKVAVLFPYNFDSIGAAEKVAQNRIIMDLYEGFKFAVEKLNKQNIKIELYPYDTKGNTGNIEYTKRILEQKEMLGMDLIIGPLYSEPFKLVYEFSRKYKINMINPLSTNETILGDNPFSFLFNPSALTQARKLAEYADATFENKTAYVFFDPRRDSVMAYAYKKNLKEKGFEVPVFNAITKDNYRENAEVLKDYKEVVVSSSYLEDSLKKFNYVTFEDKRRNRRMIKLAKILKVLPDSVGHVFVCSDRPDLNLAVSSFISTIIERPDTIPLIGKLNWTNINMIAIDQMEDIGTTYIAPNFISEHTEKYKALRVELIKKYKAMPSDKHFIAFEMMYTLGILLNDYGKYFQEGFSKNKLIPGYLTDGFSFGNKRNNQKLSIVKLIESEIIDVNREKESEY